MTVEELRAAGEGLYEGTDGTFRRVTWWPPWEGAALVISMGKEYINVEEFAAWALRRVPVEGTGPAIVDLVLADWREYDLSLGERDDDCEEAYRLAVSALTVLVDKASSVDNLLRSRYATGRKTYGHPLRANTLKPDGSRYNMRQEAAEELADALLYLRAAIEEEATR